MLREDILTGIAEVTAATTAAAHFLSEVRKKEHDPVERLKEGVAIYTELKLAYATFSDGAKRIMQTFELEDLLKIAPWFDAVVDRPDGDSHRQIVDSLRFFLRHGRKVVTLLEREADKLPREMASGEQKNQFEILRVTALEGTRVSSPERFIKLLESVRLLYGSCADLEGHNSDDLCLMSCDSGSDKSFDFLGFAKIVDCVKEVILSLWDRVVFYREKKTSTHLELIAQGLPIIDRIEKMKQEGTLVPERAEKLKRDITEGVTGFLEAGCSIKEIAGRSSYDVRLLLRPEPKLLVASPLARAESSSAVPPASVPPPSSAVPSFEGLSKGDVERAVEAYLAKRQTATGPVVEPPADEADEAC